MAKSVRYYWHAHKLLRLFASTTSSIAIALVALTDLTEAILDHQNDTAAEFNASGY